MNTHDSSLSPQSSVLNMIHPDSIAGVTFELSWDSAEAHHTDRFHKRVNFYRDTLPEGIDLMGAVPGDRREIDIPPGEAVPPHSPKRELHLKRSQLNEEKITPHLGRHYPMGLLKGLTNVFSDNVTPFRLVGLDDETITADTNHPLARYPLHLSATVESVRDKPYDRGGECILLMESITDGPGIQARHNGTPTDFSDPAAFNREDETPDPEFYGKPRLVTHIDDRAIEEITAIYGRFLKPGMDVLDLMSSWRSHLPETPAPGSVTGLGMNAEEMADNPQLTDHAVHDLNADPRLPFNDGAFDLVICTVSVEYLTDPVPVFKDVRRVLRPGGYFVVTFSNRWFPPKAIRLWTELHELERMGLVLDYFHRAGGFADLESYSVRGWPRPATDKYFPGLVLSDPVYAVWGRKAD